MIEQMEQSSISFAIGSGVAPTTQSGQSVKIPRFTNRERTWAVVVTASSLVIETTQYRHWPEFRSVLERAIAACSQVLKPDGVVRVGMRFVDEIRAPKADATHPILWSEWLVPSLFAPEMIGMAEDGYEPLAWTGAAQFATGKDCQLVLRFGPQNGYAVSPTGPLVRNSPPPPGPFFVLDFDSFWQPTSIPPFVDNDLMQICEQLRDPMRALFDRLITDKLRDEVFRKESDSV